MRNLEDKSLKQGRQKFSGTNTRKYFRGGIQEPRWPGHPTASARHWSIHDFRHTSCMRPATNNM